MTTGPDELHDWQPYLRAGLPLPPFEHGQPRQLVIGESRQEQLPSLAAVDPEEAPGGWATTVRAPSGFTVGVLFGPSQQYVTRARTLIWSPARYESAVRGADGFLRGPARIEDERGWEFLDDGEREWEEKDDWEEPSIDADADRLVTIDSSVLVAGLDAGVFGPRDLLFVSAAVALDAAAAVMDAGGQSAVSNWGWNATTPVPIDDAVLENFSRLCGNRPYLIGGDLDRTDLLVVATARLYDAVIFTTRPEAYRTLESEVRVTRFAPAAS